MNMQLLKSTKKRWLPYVIVCLLFSAVITGFASVIMWQEAKSQQQSSEMFVQNTSIMLTHHLAGIFSEADTLLQAMEHRYRDQHARGTFDPQRFSAFLTEVVGWSPGFNTAGFIDAGGKYQYAQNISMPVNVSDRDYFVRLKERPAFSGSGPMIFYGPILTKLTEKWALVMARRVENPDGSFGGVVFLLWEVDRMNNLLASIQSGQGSAIAIRTSDMAQVSRYPQGVGPDNGPGNQRVSRQLLEMIQAFPNEGIYRATSPLDQTERLYSYRKVEEFPFYVIVGQIVPNYFLKWTTNTKLVLALSWLIILSSIVVARRMYRQNQQYIQNQLNNFAEKVLAASPVAILLLNKNNQIVNANPAAQKLFGFSNAAMIGQSADKLYPDKQSEFSDIRMFKPMAQEMMVEEAMFLRHDGSIFTALKTLAKVHSLSGDVDYYIQTVVDITELKDAQDQLRHQAHTDRLTGLLNRQAGELVLHQPSALTLGDIDSFTLIMCDIDHFKRVNDQFGHLAGDTVLKHVAALLKAGVRAGDYCIRWGGEEFLMVLPGCSLDVASKLADTIGRNIAQHAFAEVGHVTMSFGLAHWNKTESVETLIDRADKALYQAKHTGRNRVCVSISDLTRSKENS